MKRLLIVVLLLIACSAWAIPPSPPGSGSGDMAKSVYDTNDNNVVDTAATASALAADPADCAAGSVATAINASGTLTCGKTIGTDIQTELSLLKGTYTDTYLCKYTASGTLLNCNVDPAGFQTQSDILDGIAAIDVSSPNNKIFGYNNDGTLGAYANHSHDDSAAHYFNTTDPTKTFQYDLQYMTTGKKITYQPTAADNYSYKVTITGNTDVTMPTSGTLATVKNEKLASFAWDNGASAVTAETASKRCTSVPAASTITGWTMVISGDPGAGGTIVNIAKDSLADTLTAGALPTTDIDASASPTVADNEVAANDETLTGWTKTVAANDIICATVATNAVATWISLSIYGTK